MLEDKDLVALLKAKREELPSKDYFDDFLREFHHRQRADLLHLPAWKLGLERLSSFVSQFEVPRYAYASAFGVFLLVAGAIGFVPAGGDGLSPAGSEAALAENRSANSFRPNSRLMLDGRLASASFDTGAIEVGSGSAIAGANTAPTRYVLDTRPVSHASPFTF